GRRLYSPGLLAAAEDRRSQGRDGRGLAGRLLLSLPRLEVRLRGARVPRRTGADQPEGAALRVRRGGRAGDRRRQSNERGLADGCAPVELGRLEDAEPQAGVAQARRRVLRAEELQFLVLLRLARAAGAGHSDRVWHLPDDELQARRQSGIRLDRLHHARRSGRLDHPLHTLDRRLGDFYLRVPGLVPRYYVMKSQG